MGEVTCRGCVCVRRCSHTCRRVKKARPLGHDHHRPIDSLLRPLLQILSDRTAGASAPRLVAAVALSEGRASFSVLRSTEARMHLPKPTCFHSSRVRPATVLCGVSGAFCSSHFAPGCRHCGRLTEAGLICYGNLGSSRGNTQTCLLPTAMRLQTWTSRLRALWLHPAVPIPPLRTWRFLWSCRPKILGLEAVVGSERHLERLRRGTLARAMAWSTHRRWPCPNPGHRCHFSPWTDRIFSNMQSVPSGTS